MKNAKAVLFGPVPAYRVAKRISNERGSDKGNNPKVSRSD